MKFITVLFVILALFVTSGCWTNDQQAVEPALIFGATVSLTGRYAREGRMIQEGYDLWAEEVNKKGGITAGGTSYLVRMIYYNDESNIETAKKMTEKLIVSDKVHFLLGPFSTTMTRPSSEVANAHGKLMVEGAGAADTLFERGFKNFFAVRPPASRDMKSLIDKLSLLEPRPETVVILNEDSGFPKSVAKGARELVLQKGLKILAHEEFSSDSADIRPLMLKIKALNPDVLLAPAYIDGSVLVVKNAVAVGLKPKVLAFSIGPATLAFTEALGEKAENVWGASLWEKELRFKGPVFGTAMEYAQKYKDKYGHWPNYMNAEASAAAVAYQLAIERAGSIEQQKVREAIASLNIETFFGLIDFDEKGRNTKKEMVVMQIQGGKKVLIYPDRIKEKDAIYPDPSWGQQ